MKRAPCVARPAFPFHPSSFVLRPSSFILSLCPFPRFLGPPRGAYTWGMPTTYTNPVYDGYFADPFVLRARSGYWAYGTGHGPEPDGRQFPVLHSQDLVSWRYVGGALPPLPPVAGEPFTAYWAPEVAERHGKF